ncbi:glutathione transferase GstA [Noviherbaspirillum massiliense]|uniref:glutathione transferase GstA n=1 Tax=Noviherbaspirillum massiliense TaxID=1465823 RepID=UPI00030263E3|nr:glutathione transferase GstA [Noviherbaspirillum massiliense]
MKLYLSPGACSLSPHIVLLEAGLKFETEKVSLADKKTESGADFRKINPKGYVPALQLENGEVLTEGPAIVQYLADKAPEKKLVPEPGSMQRYRLAEWLNFISTELHKTFGSLFNPQASEETKQAARDRMAARLDLVEQQLQKASYLMGEQFSVADAYLFTVLNWSGFLKFPLDRWPSVQQYQQRVAARPAVRAALVAEGLIKG